MTFSTFISYLSANASKVPASVVASVKREARARITERQAAGRADCILDFADLIVKLETTIAGC